MKSHVLLFLFLCRSFSHAGETAMVHYEAPPPATPSLFAKGRLEYSSMWQAYGSFTFDDNNNPSINTAMSSYRLGYMLNSPTSGSLWSGNYELMVEGLYASVMSGPGDWIAGGNLIIRRNFIPSTEKWTWYGQLGGGVVWNDIYKDYDQTLVGRSREFSLLAGVGMRYQLNAKWHLSAEVNYRHISNADTAPRNTGLDSLGGGIGFGYTF